MITKRVEGYLDNCELLVFFVNIFIYRNIWTSIFIVCGGGEGIICTVIC
jgi:hypothetical protein